VILRVLCVGRSCERTASVGSTVPFCSLPDGLRDAVGAGFREGRSPDVLAVTRNIPVLGGTGLARASDVSWPSIRDPDTRVPLVFSGAGPSVDTVPAGAGLDDIAPTLAEVMGFDRPHPEVRSGHALGGPDAASATPRLVLLIVWKGVGTADFEARPMAWPGFAALRTDEFSTMKADVGSLPLDPAAVLTTIGTGGIPRQHGITARVVLNDEGRLVEAWSKDAPVSVIASLADDWDEATDQNAKIGLIGTDRTDRGVIGGNWYVDGDHDRVEIVPRRRVVTTAVKELERGYGRDDVTDIVAVVDEGPIGRMDSNLQRLYLAARAATDDLFIVMTATGSQAAPGNAVAASDVVSQVEDAIPGRASVVQAAAPGGLYLDQAALAREKISDDAIIAALEDVRSDDGRRLMDQVFPALAVSFARYC
jgi:hypothetical protein